MSGYSDIIKELSYTTPLNSAQSYVTPKMIAGQYTSVTISFAGDQDTTVVAQFSNDGTNWDINITKSFDAGSNYENLVIYGKWMRYNITNIGVSNQTYLRLFTYANPTNNSLNAIISKVGNKYPEIQINGLPKSGFGELKVESDTKLANYIFTYGTNGLVHNTGFKTPYEGIKGYSPSALSTQIKFANGLMYMQDGLTQVNQGALVKGEQVQYIAGTSFNARFTGRFYQDPVRDAVAQGYQMQLLGIGNDDGSGGIVDFLGWGNVDTVSSTLNFGIHHYRNGSLVNSYPQNTWNIDKCDGTNIFPALNFSSYINVFQIQFQYLGAGDIIFYIENPDTGLFEPVHRIKYANANTVTNLNNPAVGMMMYAKTDSTGYPLAGDNDAIYTGSFAIAVEGELFINNSLDSISSTKTGVSPITNILTIRNKTSYYGVTNRKPIILYIIGGACDGTKNTEIILRKNQPLTAPLWNDVNTDFTPVEYDTSGTLSSFGRTLLIFNLSKVSQFHDDLVPYYLVLYPGETFSVLAQSGSSTEVSVSLSWKTL